MTTSTLSRCTLGAAALLLVASPAFAQIDYVYKKSDGKPAGGNVDKITRDSVTVKRAVGGNIDVPATDVDYVQWDGEPQELKTGRRKENSGDLAEALTAYEAAAKSATGNIQVDAEFLAARTAAKIAQADAAQLDTAIAKLDAFRKARGTSFRYYPALALLGDLQTRKGEFDAANAAFDELAKAPTNEVKWAARNAKAGVLIAQGDIDAALDAYGKVVAEKATTPVEEARQYEAMLGQASAYKAKKEYPDAISKLDEVVAKVSPRETLIQAEAYLLRGACFTEMNKPKDALFAYLHVDLLFPSEPGLHAEALYNLVRLWGAVGKPARAQATLDQLTTRYPNTEWAKKAGG